MFTGIIEETGRINRLIKQANGARIEIAAKLVTGDTNEGDSIAVNGVCLTALNVKKDSFTADVSGETLNRTTIGDLRVGAWVNLERAMTISTRLGGHIVQGHVDARGKFAEAVQTGDFWTIKIEYPKEIAAYLIYKGSITVEGISLTVASLTDEFFTVALIPKTWQLTNLSQLKSGDAVNLEADMIAKYVEKMLFGRAETSNVTREKLNQLGFIKN